MADNLLLPNNLEQQKLQRQAFLQQMNEIRCNIASQITAQLVGRDLSAEKLKEFVKTGKVLISENHVAALAIQYTDALMEALGMPNFTKAAARATEEANAAAAVELEKEVIAPEAAAPAL